VPLLPLRQLPLLPLHQLLTPRSNS
jgi:hypothetical protein